MKIDVKLKNFYLKFIFDAKADIANYKQELIELSLIKQELINYLTKNKLILLNNFNINLDKYEIEWINSSYNPEEKLYKKVYNLLITLGIDINKSALIQLTKYCTILKKEHQYNRSIELAEKRSNLRYTEYNAYVKKYYDTVHKCCLEGFGYRFANGIGTYCINRWRLDINNAKFKRKLDFAATTNKKKELLKQGYKLYDAEEAALYAKKGIPYDGVDYRVWIETSHYYDITFIKSKLFTNNLDYQRTEYVNKDYRGLSYKEIADKYVKNIDDIYKLQVDIKYKLNILLYLYPLKYVNFIRTLNETKYTFRENHC